MAPDSGISVIAGSESLIGASTQQATYSGLNLAGAPPLQLGDGIVLTTGSAAFSTTSNTTGNVSDQTGTGSYQPLVDLAADNGLNTSHSDANVLSFSFTLEDTSLNAISAFFMFATDEYPDQDVTDILGIFVNGINYAFFPNGDLVSNQSGDPNSFFNSGYAWEWDGVTDQYTVTGLVTSGVNTLSIAISDTVDNAWDSSIFIGGLKAGLTSGGGGIGDPEVVPLPAGAILLLSGLGAFGVARARRSAKV